ncbi:MAG: Branched-chain amino acid transport protein (AzlD) [Candidatus Methanofastidiosum methylothiophilum]|uniref:Branched-chain amino acid transport protein (AzlD) n=1 Tax=Candidatus Methanofastidiosum methylothiophilum TaxID=1705564 RepID=A0A150J8P2_9EURY|nr:MAG: Branched-chain amino acid transport protein (AzlD) [Candidatus Methanofastidiosum methylthiophilus]NMC76354.1 AzlD domain-containing protein [Candidatus Methanofastidiosa archaeon]
MNEIDLVAVILIILAGIITYSLRFGGLMIGDVLSKHKFVENLIKALPGALLLSFVIPSIISEGIPGLISALTAGVVAKKTNNVLIALVIGLAIIIIFRNFI